MANWNERTPQPHPRSKTARLNWLIVATLVCGGAGLFLWLGGLAGLGLFLAAVFSLGYMGRDIERSNQK